MVVGLCCGWCASAICCAGSSVCGTCCGCLRNKVSAPRLAYVGLQFFCIIMSFIMMYTLKVGADNTEFLQCIDATGQSSD